jgi:hypothetical protein
MRLWAAPAPTANSCAFNASGIAPLHRHADFPQLLCDLAQNATQRFLFATFVCVMSARACASRGSRASPRDRRSPRAPSPIWTIRSPSESEIRASPSHRSTMFDRR